jgi:hypothetical protein
MARLQIGLHSLHCSGCRDQIEIPMRIHKSPIDLLDFVQEEQEAHTCKVSRVTVQPADRAVCMTNTRGA